MRSYFLSLALSFAVFLPSLTSALEISFLPAVGGVNQTRWTCAEGEAFCREACGEMICIHAEPQCRNCSGTSNPVLNELFTSPGVQYLATSEATELDMRTLLAQPFIIVGANSIFNFVDTYNGQKLQESFAAMCGPTASRGFAIITTDTIGRVVRRPNFALCFYQQDRQQKIMKLTWTPLLNGLLH